VLQPTWAAVLAGPPQVHNRISRIRTGDRRRVRGTSEPVGRESIPANDSYATWEEEDGEAIVPQGGSTSRSS
jgi:hypothetical protein